MKFLIDAQIAERADGDGRIVITKDQQARGGVMVLSRAGNRSKD